MYYNDGIICLILLREVYKFDPGTYPDPPPPPPPKKKENKEKENRYTCTTGWTCVIVVYNYLCLISLEPIPLKRLV